MFNDVNYYDKQGTINIHMLWFETPERKYYYEAMCLVIVLSNTFIVLALGRQRLYDSVEEGL